MAITSSELNTPSNVLPKSEPVVGTEKLLGQQNLAWKVFTIDDIVTYAASVIIPLVPPPLVPTLHQVVQSGNVLSFTDTITNTDSSAVIQLLASNALVSHSIKIVFTSPIYNFSSVTASRVSVFDASKNLISSSTTLTQLSYLDATSSIQTQLDNITTTTTSLQSQITTVQTQANSLQSQINTINTTLTSLQSQITTINTTLTSLQSQITTINTTLTSLQSQIITINTTLTSLQSQINTINTTLTSHQTQINTINTTITSLQSQITSITGTTITINGTTQDLSANRTWTITVGDTLTTEGALINSATAKTTPVDADFIGLMDSAASNILKKLSWANIKATIKSYFDAIYYPIAGKILKDATSYTSASTNVDEVAACVLLPAGTIVTGDFLDLLTSVSTGGTLTKTWKVFVGSSAQTVGAIQSGGTQIAVNATLTTFKTSLLYRAMAVISNTSILTLPAAINSSGYSGGTTGFGSVAITIPTLSSNTYWIVTLQRTLTSTDALIYDFLRLHPVK